MKRLGILPLMADIWTVISLNYGTRYFSSWYICSLIGHGSTDCCKIMQTRPFHFVVCFFMCPSVISVYILFLSHLRNGWSGTVFLMFAALCSVTCQACLAWKFIKELGGFMGCIKWWSLWVLLGDSGLCQAKLGCCGNEQSSSVTAADCWVRIQALRWATH